MSDTNTNITAETNKKAETEITEETAAAETAENTESAETAAAETKAFNFDLFKKITVLSVSLLIFLFSVVSVIYYITTVSKSEFHADCTDTIMWANASYESGKVYDPDFTYACFLPFGTNLIMQPMISIFGLSLKAHIIGMMGFFILLTVFLFLMLKEMKISTPAALTGTAFFLGMTLASAKMREIFWGHTIYYSLGILFLLIGAFLIFRLRNLLEKGRSFADDEKAKKKNMIHVIVTVSVLLLFVMFAATDGISAMSIFLVPMIGAVFAEYFVDTNNKLISRKTVKIVCLVISLGIMTVLGILMNNAWKGDLKAGYADAYSGYSSMGEWKDHVLGLPEAWMSVLGVENIAGKLLFGKEGIINLIYIFSALLLFVLPVVATCFYGKYGNDSKGRAMKFWVWSHWAVTALVLSGYIFGLLSSANWRLVPVISTSAILSTAFVLWAVADKQNVSRLAVLLAVPFMLTGFMNISGNLAEPKDCYKKNNLFALADFLDENDLHYGYATFWYANSLSVVSDSRVRARDITVEEKGITKRIYQVSTKWYEIQDDVDKYFILLTEGEYNTLGGAENPTLAKAESFISTETNGQKFYAFIFAENPM